jgi:hypothetical protein
MTKNAGECLCIGEAGGRSRCKGRVEAFLRQGEEGLCCVLLNSRPPLWRSFRLWTIGS